MSRALVIGCGGTLGGAWTVAALKALSDYLDWDPSTADLLQGTSAGAEYVTMLASGISVDELVGAQQGTTHNPHLRAHAAATPGRIPPLPRLRLGSVGLLYRAHGITALSGAAPVGGGDASWLANLSHTLNPHQPWVAHPRTRLIAMDYATGQRVAFGASGAPAARLDEALRASWAIPGWFPPVEIEGKRYIDGGAASTASVDLLIGESIDEAIVIAPMASLSGARGPGAAGLAENLLRTAMTRRLRTEIEQLERAGTRVIVLDATREDLCVMGGNFMDYRRRQGVFDYAMDALPRRVRELPLEPVS